MCGIAGIIGRKVSSDMQALQRMLGAIIHRGPDDSGVWCDEDRKLALGHQRLAIIDVSPLGCQPMVSDSGRYVIVFNGEIYNHLELRKKLEAEEGICSWRGGSDTETILAAVEAWGVEKAVEEFVGMFAFAVWDRGEGVLFLIRDRIGEKPLYYGVVKGNFVFASELKSIKAVFSDALEIDKQALSNQLRYGYVPNPLSIYKNINKLQPGTMVRLAVSATGAFKLKSNYHYWRAKDYSPEIIQDANLSDEEVIEKLKGLMVDAVSRQMVADVPLGAFLSGGIDSSLIVALMQAKSSKPVKTFTIGFDDKKFNEAEYAKAVARHLGTEHTELYVDSKQAIEVIPSLPMIYDEPFADSSQIPTYLVSKMTREHVTVSISGDGGDELFGGYPRYQFAESVWRTIQRFPKVGRRVMARSVGLLSAQQWDSLFTRLLPVRYQQVVGGHRLHRLKELLRANVFEDMYNCLVAQWQRPQSIMAGAHSDHGLGKYRSGTDLQQSLLWRMRQVDIARYLSDDILVKVDRASMGVSLESRAPMLDHRVVEFALSLPEKYLVRNGCGKWILKQLLYQYVPKSLVERPKAGFAVPVAEWLRGPMRDWAESLLDPKLLREQGLLEPEPILKMWREHLSGKYDRQSYLWNILMFQAWFLSGTVSSQQKLSAVA